MVIETEQKNQKSANKVKPEATKKVEIIEMSEESQKQVEATAKANPLDELVGHAEMAYAAYLEAERQVIRAYRDNELQLSKAHRKAEQQAQSIYDAAVAEALKAREEALAQAMKAHDKALEKAEAALIKDKEDADSACQESIL